MSKKKPVSTRRLFVIFGLIALVITTVIYQTTMNQSSADVAAPNISVSSNNSNSTTVTTSSATGATTATTGCNRDIYLLTHWGSTGGKDEAYGFAKALAGNLDPFNDRLADVQLANPSQVVAMPTADFATVYNDGGLHTNGSADLYNGITALTAYVSSQAPRPSAQKFAVIITDSHSEDANLTKAIALAQSSYADKDPGQSIRFILVHTTGDSAGFRAIDWTTAGGGYAYINDGAPTSDTHSAEGASTTVYQFIKSKTNPCTAPVTSTINCNDRNIDLMYVAGLRYTSIPYTSGATTFPNVYVDHAASLVTQLQSSLLSTDRTALTNFVPLNGATAFSTTLSTDPNNVTKTITTRPYGDQSFGIAGYSGTSVMYSLANSLAAASTAMSHSARAGVTPVVVIVTGGIPLTASDYASAYGQAVNDNKNSGTRFFVIDLDPTNNPAQATAEKIAQDTGGAYYAVSTSAASSVAAADATTLTQSINNWFADCRYLQSTADTDTITPGQHFHLVYRYVNDSRESVTDAKITQALPGGVLNSANGGSSVSLSIPHTLEPGDTYVSSPIAVQAKGWAP